NSLLDEYLCSPEYKKLSSLHPHIQLVRDLTAELLPISCSAVHIKKTFMNLVTNGVESMGETGTIRIISRRLGKSGPGAGQKQWAELAIRDEGSGIGAEDSDHIFEPFYTTKKMGRSGTGLGLAVVWNTMDDHGGSVTVENNSDGPGTTFVLHFPLAEAAGERQEAVPQVDLSGRGEQILVVDDEPQQRDIAAAILKNYGYRVDTVASGEEAIAFCGQQPVDLVLLDMIMAPGINGRQIHEKICAMYPGQKAVFVSGYSEDEEIRRARELGICGFIKKPYSMEELARAVKKELQPQAAGSIQG
ncbi:MAG: response regulator, partial [Desulfobulbaceae bacterium]|nr:response regulator [Desulfobulbaceae bacterium]